MINARVMLLSRSYDNELVNGYVASDAYARIPARELNAFFTAFLKSHARTALVVCL